MMISTRKFRATLAKACAFVCVACTCSLAFGQALPDGKGKAEFVHNCTACHRADMVTRVKKTPDDWRKSVDDMAARGTDGTKEDLDNVVLYLDTYFALPAPADARHSTLSPSDIEHAQHIIANNGCLTCHRIEQQGADAGPSLNGIGTRHTADEIRAAILNHHSTAGLANTSPAPSYEGKISDEDLDDLVRYLVSLPPLPQ
jgi:mono/diheme cytochrome c family protein